MRAMDEFEVLIGYNFKNKNVLREALTHTSFSNESKNKKIKHNERLEFLGDSILGVIVSTYLFKNRCDLPEGDLSKIRAAIVCESSLKKVADEINVGGFIYLGKGEERTGGRERISILADVIEAVIAAIYLDGGMKNAQNFIFKYMDKIIEDATKEKADKDYKTQLQELVQKEPDHKIQYKVVGEKGPDHCKTFTVELRINDQTISIADGRSKKEAEKSAAQIALKEYKKKQKNRKNEKS